jgi:hypothetical protein
VRAAAHSLSSGRASLERATARIAPPIVPEIPPARRSDHAFGALTTGRVSGELERFAEALTGVARDVIDAEAERTAVIRGIASGAGFAP